MIVGSPWVYTCCHVITLQEQGGDTCCHVTSNTCCHVITQIFRKKSLPLYMWPVMIDWVFSRPTVRLGGVLYILRWWKTPSRNTQTPLYISIRLLYQPFDWMIHCANRSWLHLHIVVIVNYKTLKPHRKLKPFQPSPRSIVNWPGKQSPRLMS